ncbi:MAG: hypothetical protein WDA21_03820 [Bacilli bacterium]
MKVLQKIINQVHFDTPVNNDYYIPVDLLLKRLLDYEVDIPDDFYEKCKQKKHMGDIATEYIEKINNIDIIYDSDGPDGIYRIEELGNFGGHLYPNISYIMAKTSDTFYVVLQVYLNAEIKNGKRSVYYTDGVLLKFEDFIDFFDLLNEVADEATFSIEVDSDEYLVTPQIIGDELQVKRVKDGEEIPKVNAVDKEELVEQIRKYNKDNKGNNGYIKKHK